MDPTLYDFESPLAVFSNVSTLPPLSEEKNADGKSYVNPEESQAPDAITLSGKKLSKTYEEFAKPLDNSGQKGRGGFDVHIYYFQENEENKKFAKELWERIRREFPELRIYRFWEKPIGPHPLAMFEVNIFTPAQFGAFIPWLVINRGPLSCLVHPNAVDESGNSIDPERDHTQRATWMGERVLLDMSMFRKWKRAMAEKKAGGA